jgi:hypothetical protein
MDIDIDYLQCLDLLTQLKLQHFFKFAKEMQKESLDYGSEGVLQA